jgi:DNA-binding MarR family transcriptional regulator
VSGDFFDYDPLELDGTGRYLTKSELWTWTRFLDAGRLIEELLAQHVSREHDMTHSDYEVLVRLDGAGGRMRMAVLAQQVVSSAQKLTHTANRLERRGWIAREPVSDDARGLEAVLLPAGRASLAAASGPHAALIKQFLLDLLSEDEQEVIAEAMNRVSQHLRLHRAGEPCDRCSTEPTG